MAMCLSSAEQDRIMSWRFALSGENEPPGEFGSSVNIGILRFKRRRRGVREVISSSRIWKRRKRGGKDLSEQDKLG